MKNTNSSVPDHPDDSPWHLLKEMEELDQEEEAVIEAQIRLEQFNEAKKKILESLQELEEKIVKSIKISRLFRRIKTEEPKQMKPI